jgi:spoIIIJ-associated protein
MENLQESDDSYETEAQEVDEVDIDIYIDEADEADSNPDTANESDTDTDVDDAESDDVDDVDVDEGSESDLESSSAKKTAAEVLQEETMLAADFVEGLLDTANIGGDLQLSVVNNRPLIEIIDEEDPDLRKIIGKDRSGLDALQYITRLAVQKETGKKSRLLVDINGYSQDSRKLLIEHALEAINTVNETGEEFEFDPMNSFERKLIHDIVRENGLTSYSIDIKENRRVVISPETIGDGYEEYTEIDEVEIDKVEVDEVETDDGTYEIEVDEVED